MFEKYLFVQTENILWDGKYLWYKYVEFYFNWATHSVFLTANFLSMCDAGQTGQCVNMIWFVKAILLFISVNLVWMFMRGKKKHMSCTIRQNDCDICSNGQPAGESSSRQGQKTCWFQQHPQQRWEQSGQFHSAHSYMHRTLPALGRLVPCLRVSWQCSEGVLAHQQH